MLLSFCLSYCYISSTLYDVLYKNFYPKQFFEKEVFLHSMARANLNKSVWLVTNTTTGSKYLRGPESRFIKFSKTVSYEVNCT